MYFSKRLTCARSGFVRLETKGEDGYWRAAVRGDDPYYVCAAEGYDIFDLSAKDIESLRKGYNIYR